MCLQFFIFPSKSKLQHIESNVGFFLLLWLPLSRPQWCHIGASLHSRTPFTYRVPADKWWPVISLNVLLAAVPALLALRCHSSPTFFMKPVPKGQDQPRKEEELNLTPATDCRGIRHIKTRLMFSGTLCCAQTA